MLNGEFSLRVSVYLMKMPSKRCHGLVPTYGSHFHMEQGTILIGVNSSRNLPLSRWQHPHTSGIPVLVCHSSPAPAKKTSTLPHTQPILQSDMIQVGEGEQRRSGRVGAGDTP